MTDHKAQQDARTRYLIVARNVAQPKFGLLDEISMEKAEVFRSSTCPRDTDGRDGVPEHYKTCSIGPTEFLEYGEDLGGLGVYLFFDFAKKFAYLTALCVLLCVPAFAFNMNGSAAEDTYFFSKWTLGNIGTSNNDTNEYKFEHFGLELDKKKMGLVTGLADAAMCLILLMFWLYMMRRSARQYAMYHNDFLDISDYTVEVRGLPDDATRLEVAIFFKMFGPVSDVALIRKDFSVINKFVERGKLRMKLEHAISMDKESDIKSYSKKIKKLDRKIDWKKSKRGGIVRAFVTFENVESVKQVLDAHLDVGCCLTLCDVCYKSTYVPRFRRSHTLGVRASPMPSEINYANLAVSTCTKMRRRLCTLLASALVMVITFGVLLTAQHFQRDEESCPAIVTQNEVNCYCQQIGIQNAIDEDVCSGWLKDYLISKGLVGAAGLVLVFVNFLIGYLVRLLARYESHNSKNDTYRSTFQKRVWLAFFNTAVVVLLVNMDFRPLIDKDLPLLKGRFRNFSTEFFGVVGVTIMLAMCAKVFMPHTPPCMFNCCCHSRRRAKIRTLARNNPDALYDRFESQKQLNKAMKGMRMDLPRMYAGVISALMIALFYSPGMPVLIGLMLLTFIFLYNLEKYNYFTSYSFPKAALRHSNELHDLAVSYIPWAVFIHCIMAVAMYTSPNTESYIVEQDTVRDIIGWATIHVGGAWAHVENRAIQWNCLPVFTLGVLLLLLWVLSWRITASIVRCMGNTACGCIFQPIWRCCCRQPTPPVTPTLSEARQQRLQNEEPPFLSYQLQGQPELRYAFMMTGSERQLRPVNENLRVELENVMKYDVSQGKTLPKAFYYQYRVSEENTMWTSKYICEETDAYKRLKKGDGGEFVTADEKRGDTYEMKTLHRRHDSVDNDAVEVGQVLVDMEGVGSVAVGITSDDEDSKVIYVDCECCRVKFCAKYPKEPCYFACFVCGYDNAVM